MDIVVTSVDDDHATDIDVAADGGIVANHSAAINVVTDIVFFPSIFTGVVREVFLTLLELCLLS